MNNPAGIAMFVLLLSHNMNAQTPVSGASAADQCSNEVLNLSLKAVKTPGPLHRMSDPEPVPVWDGLIEIKLKNVSTLVVHLEELATDWEYEVIVLDASGIMAAMTDYGKKLPPGKVPTGGQYIGPIASVALPPASELTVQMYVSRIYKIEPGQAYTVTLRREEGLPKVDQVGKAVKRPGLSCSLAIPAGPLVDVQ
ncbi:MAG: hypothetical protein ABSG03_13055 [Bryobacteraceae bacterium]